MKKLLIMSFLSIYFMSTGLFPNTVRNKKFSFHLNAAYFISHDADFREIYGNGTLLPHLEVSYSLSRIFSLEAAYGTLTKNMEHPYGDVTAELSSKQQFISAKIGYTHPLVKQLDFFISGGLALFSFSEEIDSEVCSEQALGFVIDAGLLYHLGTTFFTELKLGYLNGKKEVAGIPVTLGGILSGIGFGIRF